MSMMTRFQLRGALRAIAGSVILLGALSATAALTITAAGARSATPAWPTRPILAVIPFSAGNAKIFNVSWEYKG